MLKYLLLQLTLLLRQILDFLVLLFRDLLDGQRLAHLVALLLDEVLAKAVDSLLAGLVHAGIELLVGHLFEFASEHFCMHWRPISASFITALNR